MTIGSQRDVMENPPGPVDSFLAVAHKQLEVHLKRPRVLCAPTAMLPAQRRSAAPSAKLRTEALPALSMKPTKQENGKNVPNLTTKLSGSTKILFGHISL